MMDEEYHKEFQVERMRFKIIVYIRLQPLKKFVDGGKKKKVYFFLKVRTPLNSLVVLLDFQNY